MTSDSQSLDVLSLIERMRSDDTLMKAASDAARNQGPANGMLPEVEIMRHISAILDAIAAAASGDAARIAVTSTMVDDLAIDRLEQGISLQDVLHGFRLGRIVLVQRLIEIGRETIGIEALLALLAPLDDLVGTVQERIIVAYRNAERDSLRGRRATQIEALRELLSGGSPDWASEAGLRPSDTYYCVVADISIPREARRLEQAWMSPLGVSGIVHGYLCRVATELPATDAHPGLVVTSPRVAVDELADTYALCRHALATYRLRGLRGRQPLLGAAQDIALAAQPLLGQLLTRELLANFDPADDFHRDLALTARAYIANGQRADDAAAMLHIHANTLRYRLRRFNELLQKAPVTPTGDRSLLFAMNTWWALGTWLQAVDAGDTPGESS